MAEIEFIIPTIQYGNVHVKGTPEELETLDPYRVGVTYMKWANLLEQGVQHGKTLDLSPDKSQEVTRQYQESPGGVDASVTFPTPEEIAAEMSDGDHDTEQQAVAAFVKSTLGATEVSEYNSDGPTSDVPWENEAPAPKAEPWKTGPKTKPAKIEW